MIVPTIHMNGSGASSLIDGLRDACGAIDNARAVLNGICPHDRDYYPQGSDAGPQARAEHYARVEKLNDIETELTELYRAIYAAKGD